MASSDRTAKQIPLPIDGATFSIPLTKGYTAIIDVVDADLAVFNWCVIVSLNTQYATRGKKVRKKHYVIHLHRVILSRMLGRELTRSEKVDHIDGNGLNNTRANLRLATHAQNVRNRGAQVNSKSGVKGVSWNSRRGKWYAQIQADGKKLNLGLYEDLAEAQKAYTDAAHELHGEFAHRD